MKRRQKRMLLVAGGALAAALVVALLLSVFQQNLMYFYSATEVVNKGVPDNARFRFGGLVVPGSVAREPGSLAVSFALADCENSVPVSYTGILPDLFREGQGIVATGRLSNGHFVADEVLAKHDENYMPPELAKRLKSDTGHSCAPFKSLETS